MANKLPRVIKPYHFAKQNLSFIGKYQLFDFPTIKESVLRDSTLVIHLEFSMQNNIALAIGNVVFDAYLPCAYCLEEVLFHYDNEVRLAFAPSSAKIADDFELVETLDQYSEFNTSDIITEEVVLNLPLFIQHKHCRIEPKQAENTLQSRHPFAGLKDLY